MKDAFGIERVSKALPKGFDAPAVLVATKAAKKAKLPVMDAAERAAHKGSLLQMKEVKTRMGPGLRRPKKKGGPTGLEDIGPVMPPQKKNPLSRKTTKVEYKAMDGERRTRVRAEMAAEQAALKAARKKEKAAVGQTLKTNTNQWRPTNRQLANIGTSAAIAGGGGYAAHKVSKRDNDKARQGASVALGGLAGAAATNAVQESGGWAYKRHLDNVQRTMGPKDRAKLKAHRVATGMDGVKLKDAPHKVRQNFYSKYPTDIVGGKGRRLLAAADKPNVVSAVITGGALAGAGATYAANHRRKKINKALAPIAQVNPKVRKEKFLRKPGAQFIARVRSGQV
jgi:hypothetical protein